MGAVVKTAMHVMHLQTGGTGQDHILVDVGILEDGVFANPVKLLAYKCLGLHTNGAAYQHDKRGKTE